MSKLREKSCIVVCLLAQFSCWAYSQYRNAVEHPVELCCRCCKYEMSRLSSLPYPIFFHYLWMDLTKNWYLTISFLPMIAKSWVRTRDQWTTSLSPLAKHTGSRVSSSLFFKTSDLKGSEMHFLTHAITQAYILMTHPLVLSKNYLYRMGWDGMLYATYTHLANSNFLFIATLRKLLGKWIKVWC